MQDAYDSNVLTFDLVDGASGFENLTFDLLDYAHDFHGFAHHTSLELSLFGHHSSIIVLRSNDLMLDVA